MEQDPNIIKQSETTEQQPIQQTIIINQPKSNGMGTAGFVLALVALFLGWIPVLGWIMWFLGTLFSLIGVFKQPRGLAIAGLVISFIGLIVVIVLAGVILAAVGMSSCVY